MVIPLKDDNPTTTKPVVTLALIAICVVVYFAVQPHDQRESERFLYENAAIPCEITTGEALSAEEILVGCNAGGDDEPYFPDKNVWLSTLYSMFLHGSIIHLGGNMLFLWIFGNNVEDHLGKVGFLAFYLVTGLAASGAHIATDVNSNIPVIGASGAIAGVMGGYLVFFPHARVLTIIPLFIFIQFVHLPAWGVLIGWFVLQFFTQPDTGVAYMAHIGGFVAGALIALPLKPLLGGPGRRPPPDPGYGYPTFGRGPYR